MKTNVQLITIGTTTVIAKYIGDFDYEDFTYFSYGEVRFANVYQLLDGSLITIFGENDWRHSTTYDKSHVYVAKSAKGGKRARKTARRQRTMRPDPHLFKDLEELPF